jgi:hypothetical protein
VVAVLARVYVHCRLRGCTIMEWVIIAGLIGTLALLLYLDRNDY